MGTASDVWSMGCILYQIVYGLPPFHHLAMFPKLKAITDSSYRINFPPSSEYVLAEIDDVLINTLQACLQRAPKSRPSILQLLMHPFLRPLGKMN